MPVPVETGKTGSQKSSKTLGTSNSKNAGAPSQELDSAPSFPSRNPNSKPILILLSLPPHFHSQPSGNCEKHSTANPNTVFKCILHAPYCKTISPGTYSTLL